MLNSLLLMGELFPGDWSQFLSGVVATAIGFALTIIGERTARCFARISRRKTVATELKTELGDITDKLNEWDETKIEAAEFLPTNVWDMVVSLGELSLLNISKKKCSLSGQKAQTGKQQEEISLSLRISKLYSLVKSFNAWLQMQTKFYFENMECVNRKILLENNRLKEILLEEIKDIKSQL